MHKNSRKFKYFLNFGVAAFMNNLKTFIHQCPKYIENIKEYIFPNKYNSIIDFKLSQPAQYRLIKYNPQNTKYTPQFMKFKLQNKTTRFIPNVTVSENDLCFLCQVSHII